MRAAHPRVTLKRAAQLFPACLLATFLAGCGRAAPEAQLLEIAPADGTADLARLLPGAWDRVCILAPYSTNSRAAEVLGSGIDITGSSDIGWSDSIALLVTMQGDQATGLYEVPLDGLNFARLGGHCYQHDAARFTVDKRGARYATAVDPPPGNHAPARP